MELILIIEGAEFAVPFTYKGITDVCKLLGTPKFVDMEKMLSKVGFDNLPRILQTLFKADGQEFSTSQIMAAIPDTKFPIKFINALGAALRPDDADELIDAVSQGN